MCKQINLSYKCYYVLPICQVKPLYPLANGFNFFRLYICPALISNSSITSVTETQTSNIKYTVVQNLL